MPPASKSSPRRLSRNERTKSDCGQQDLTLFLFCRERSPLRWIVADQQLNMVIVDGRRTLEKAAVRGKKGDQYHYYKGTITQPFKNPINPPPTLSRNPNPEMPKSFPTAHPIRWAQRIHATRIAMKLITLTVPGRTRKEAGRRLIEPHRHHISRHHTAEAIGATLLSSHTIAYF